MVKQVSVWHLRSDFWHNNRGEGIWRTADQRDPQPIEEGFALLRNSCGDNGTAKGGKGLELDQVGIKKESDEWGRCKHSVLDIDGLNIRTHTEIRPQQGGGSSYLFTTYVASWLATVL